MYRSIFSNFSQLGNKGKGRRLEGSEKLFNFFFGAGPDISSRTKFPVHDFLVLFCMYIKSGAIIRGKGRTNVTDAGIETKLEAVGYEQVFVEELVFCEQAMPCFMVIGRERLILSEFEGSLELHDRFFHTLNIRDSGWLPS